MQLQQRPAQLYNRSAPLPQLFMPRPLVWVRPLPPAAKAEGAAHKWHDRPSPTRSQRHSPPLDSCKGMLSAPLLLWYTRPVPYQGLEGPPHLDLSAPPLEQLRCRGSRASPPL